MLPYASLQLNVLNESWIVYRRYSKFRELHDYMRLKYKEVRGFIFSHLSICHLMIDIRHETQRVMTRGVCIDLLVKVYILGPVSGPACV